ncbi:MAG: NAD(P)H nitroreductase [Ruminococcaceae bacterium]|nr:NAD(P)H nitroreductase [Oscillospiraceae bacterium]
MESFEKLVMNRESCRDFSDRPVEIEKITSILKTALLSPSACNSQPWHFTVATGENAKKTASCTHELGMNKFTDNCPAFIIINEEEAALSARLGGAVKKQEYAQMDIGIAAAHIVLAARDLGLSTCILGWFNEKQLADAVGISHDKRIRLIIALGYAATDELRPKKRKDISDMVTILT